MLISPRKRFCDNLQAATRLHHDKDGGTRDSRSILHARRPSGLFFGGATRTWSEDNGKRKSLQGARMAAQGNQPGSCMFRPRLPTTSACGHVLTVSFSLPAPASTLMPHQTIPIMQSAFCAIRWLEVGKMATIRLTNTCGCRPTVAGQSSPRLTPAYATTTHKTRVFRTLWVRERPRLVIGGRTKARGAGSARRSRYV